MDFGEAGDEAEDSPETAEPESAPAEVASRPQVLVTPLITGDAAGLGLAVVF